MSFEEYEQEVRRYGVTWFRHDDEAMMLLRGNADVRDAVLRRVALAAEIGTEDLYRVGERWVTRRLALHRQLVTKALSVTAAGGDGDLGPDPLPLAVLLLGLPGSGKSSLLQPVARELIAKMSPVPGLVVDADDVRLLVPEYADGLGSVVVQEETTFIANRLLVEEATTLGANLIIDKVGKPSLAVAMVDYLRASGWTVWCLCAHVEVDVALERAQQRALESRRYVKPEYIRKVCDEPVATYRALRDKGLFAGGALFDTDVRLGSRPVVIEAEPEELFGSPDDPSALWPEA